MAVRRSAIEIARMSASSIRFDENQRDGMIFFKCLSGGAVQFLILHSLARVYSSAARAKSPSPAGVQSPQIWDELHGKIVTQ